VYLISEPWGFYPMIPHLKGGTNPVIALLCILGAFPPLNVVGRGRHSVHASMKLRQPPKQVTNTRPSRPA